MTERQIAARLGMSRTPVREAVHRLEGEGTLERQRSGALVVRPYSMEEFLHVLAARRLLEGEAARAAMQTHIDNVRAFLMERLNAI